MVKTAVLGQISEQNDGARTATILYIVLKFYVYLTCFQGKVAGTNFGRKVEQKERRKIRASAVTIRFMRLQRRHNYTHTNHTHTHTQAVDKIT